MGTDKQMVPQAKSGIGIYPANHSNDEDPHNFEVCTLFHSLTSDYQPEVREEVPIFIIVVGWVSPTDQDTAVSMDTTRWSATLLTTL